MTGAGAPASRARRLALAAGEVHLWTVHTQTRRLVDTCATDLDPGEYDTISGLAREADRKLATVSHGLRRRVLAGYLGMSPRDLVFARGRYGKPKLQNAEELRFSVAHSEDVVVLAVTRGRDVGVDVEFARPEDDLLALANRSFSRAEYRALASLPKNQILPAFYRTWTQKEAFVKLLGTGLQLPLDSFDVEVDVGRPCRLLAGRECSSADLRCALMSIPAPRGYAGALAVLGEAPAIRSHTLAPF